MNHRKRIIQKMKKRLLFCNPYVKMDKIYEQYSFWRVYNVCF